MKTKEKKRVVKEKLKITLFLCLLLSFSLFNLKPAFSSEESLCETPIAPERVTYKIIELMNIIIAKGEHKEKTRSNPTTSTSDSTSTSDEATRKDFDNAIQISFNCISKVNKTNKNHPINEQIGLEQITLLMLASHFGDIETVNMLLKNTDTKVNLQNDDGQTELIATISSNKNTKEEKEKISYLLLKKGADPFMEDDRGFNSYSYIDEVFDLNSPTSSAEKLLSQKKKEKEKEKIFSYQNESFQLPPPYRNIPRRFFMTTRPGTVGFILTKSYDTKTKAKGNGISRFIKVVCKDEPRVKPIYLKLEKIFNSKNPSPSEEELLGRCIMSASITGALHVTMLHFGLNQSDPDNEKENFEREKRSLTSLLDTLFSTTSELFEEEGVKKLKSNLQEAVKTIANLYNENKQHTGLHFQTYNYLMEERAKIPSKGTVIIKDVFLAKGCQPENEGSGWSCASGVFAYGVGKGSLFKKENNFFDFEDFKARAFVYFFNNIKNDIVLSEWFKESSKVNADEDNPYEDIEIIIDRPKYDSARARLSSGGPFFHLTSFDSYLKGDYDKDNFKKNRIFYGYKTGAKNIINHPSPPLDTTNWASYLVGLSKESNFSCNNYTSSSLNRNPFGEIIDTAKREEKNSFNIRSCYDHYYGFFILRYEGKEYITLEGIPCHFDGSFESTDYYFSRREDDPTRGLYHERNQEKLNCKLVKSN